METDLKVWNGKDARTKELQQTNLIFHLFELFWDYYLTS